MNKTSKERQFAQLRLDALRIMPYRLLHFLVKKNLLHQFLVNYAMFRVKERQGIALSPAHFRDEHIIDQAFCWITATYRAPWQLIDQEYIFYCNAA